MRLRDIPLPLVEIDSDYELTRVHALVALVLVLALVVGAVVLARPSTPVGAFTVELTSDPSGAEVFVGSEPKPRGRTPIPVLVTSNDVVRLVAPEVTEYRVTFVAPQAFHATMLRGKKGRPVLWQVRHTVPGVSLGDVRLAPSGRQVTYSVGAQQWGYDLFTEEHRRLDAFELLGGGIISPKGGYALQLDAKTSRNVVRLADIAKGTTREVLVVPTQTAGGVNDIAWHPSGQYALVALDRAQDGKGRIGRLDPFTLKFDTLLEAPVPVLGSFRFAPDGHRATFFVSAGRTVLAYADLREPSSFRQLADLAPASTTGTDRRAGISVNPSSWSPDGRFVYYVAPQATDIPQGTVEFRRSRPLTLYRHDLVRLPQPVSTITDDQGDPWYAISVLSDGTALGLLRNDADSKFELYRILLDPLTITYMDTLPFPADENAQIEFSGPGTSMLITTSVGRGGTERWVLCLD